LVLGHRHEITVAPTPPLPAIDPDELVCCDGVKPPAEPAKTCSDAIDGAILPGIA